MNGDLAIKAGASIPKDLTKMATVTCKTCGCEFGVFRRVQFADPAGVGDQAANVKEILAGEHCDDKFTEHLNEYELD